jgi:peptidoglycan/LPS O-acetylase OafA/YrhL
MPHERDDSARLRELDSLRGVAAIAVVLFHLTYLHHPQIAVVHVPWGHFGVELFFVISGFVIFLTVERSRTVMHFGISRFARLYPTYWCAVLFTASVVWLLDTVKVSAFQVGVNLTMVQVYGRVPNIDDSYWTLALELTFYFFMALLLFFRRLKQVEVAMAIWLALDCAGRLYLHLSHRNVGWSISHTTLLYYGQFFILGMCVYEHWAGKATRFTPLIMTAAVAMSLWGAPSSSMSAAPLEYVIVTALVTGLVWIAVSRRPRVLRWAPLLFLGNISYPLYLIHQRAGGLFLAKARAIGLSDWGALALVLALLILIAYAIHRLVETPGRVFLRARLTNLLTARPDRPPTIAGPAS